MKKSPIHFLAGLICSMFVFQNVHAAAPTWTVEASGGIFKPEDDNWKTHYGKDYMPEISFGFARRFFYVLDVGMAINYGRDNGTGYLPRAGIKRGNVLYEMGPIDVFAVLRGRFTEGQWIVPYIGGGYTRFNYQETVEDQDKTRGGFNAQHVRAGLQFLLDPLDSDAAKEIQANWGVINSYLYFEARQTTADIDEVKLGGVSYKMGVMLEY